MLKARFHRRQSVGPVTMLSRRESEMLSPQGPGATGTHRLVLDHLMSAKRRPDAVTRLRVHTAHDLGPAVGQLEDDPGSARGCTCFPFFPSHQKGGQGFSLHSIQNYRLPICSSLPTFYPLPPPTGSLLVSNNREFNSDFTPSWKCFENPLQELGSSSCS